MEYRDDFVQALRSGKKVRQGMFRVLEARHASDFADGPNGVKYYNDLFDVVQAADVPEALEEFQTRFFPLLDPDRSRSRAAPPVSDAPKKSNSAGRWAATACAVIVLAAGTIFGLNAIPNPPKRARAATTPTVVAPPPAPVAVVTEVPAEAAATVSAEPVPQAPAVQPESE